MKLSKCTLTATVLLVAASRLQAGTWVPTTGGDWNTPANWSDNTVPNAVGATATLDKSLGGQTINLSAPATIGTMNVVGTFVTSSGSLTFTGGTLTFDNNGADAPLFLWTSSSQRRNLVFACNIHLDDNLIISHSGTAGSGVTISGNISGTGGLRSSGSYNLTLSGDNSGWSGDLSCGGASRIGYDTAVRLGDGTGTLKSGTFWRTVVSTVTLNHALDVGTGTLGLMNSVTATSPRTILTTDSITGTSGKILINVGGGWGDAAFFTEFTGNFNYTASGGIELAASTVARRNTLVFNNASGTQSLVKVVGDGDIVRGPGGGTTIITGASTYGGPTTVKGGTLLVNGTHAFNNGKAGNYTVEAGALGGSGTITADVTVKANATLAPGSSIGTLAIAGDLTLDASGILRFAHNATQADRVDVTGTLLLPAALTLHMDALDGAPAAKEIILFTYGTCSRTDFSGWTVTSSDVKYAVSNDTGNGRILATRLPYGTLITIR